MLKRIKAFIPQHMKNRTVLKFYGWLCRHTGVISKKKIARHAEKNKKELAQNPIYLQKNPFIENQAEWDKIVFGTGKKANMAHSGCGIIAVYNALKALGEKVSPDMMAMLISSFERHGAIFNGRLGTAPNAIYDYFIEKGYDTIQTDSNTIDSFNEIGAAYDVAIVTIYNDKYDITEQIHTICITKNSDNEYMIHNAYYRLNGQWAQKRTKQYVLGEAVQKIGVNAAVICIVGVRRKKIHF